jgi:hypothetical protein
MLITPYTYHLQVMKEIKFLLPKPALSLREIKPAQWVNLGERENEEEK